MMTSPGLNGDCGASMIRRASLIGTVRASVFVVLLAYRALKNCPASIDFSDAGKPPATTHSDVKCVQSFRPKSRGGLLRGKAGSLERWSWNVASMIADGKNSTVHVASALACSLRLIKNRPSARSGPKIGSTVPDL